MSDTTPIDSSWYYRHDMGLHMHTIHLSSQHIKTQIAQQKLGSSLFQLPISKRVEYTQYIGIEQAILAWQVHHADQLQTPWFLKVCANYLTRHTRTLKFSIQWMLTDIPFCLTGVDNIPEGDKLNKTPSNLIAVDKIGEITLAIREPNVATWARLRATLVDHKSLVNGNGSVWLCTAFLRKEACWTEPYSVTRKYTVLFCS